MWSETEATPTLLTIDVYRDDIIPSRNVVGCLVVFEGMNVV